ncbi:nitrate reductase cytochrome c-type subunit [Sulfurimonas paralvinellae]|uniref:Periplasmic nitrate reductase, electron transfer subunit n=1 Tax=Sulfurimonas paralvinellae TaxID=317658 RepID=A0A7M1B6D9_9BACT|nr:nitrate reductase cytochrome c-type subunit [Sulfurimonas paralvinellae]QOP45299.1 nitrate reductase [Sulfurimonas paralvinellae]
MKILTKITIGLAASALLLVGCNSAATGTSAKADKSVTKPTITEANLGYRGTTDLLKEDVVPPAVAYHSAPPGASKRFKRAYQDAPPMIPHSTEGLLPITKNNNACLGCHMPAVAASMGATPIPVSHFTNFRPKTAVKGDEILKNGKAIKNTSSEKLANVSIKVDKDEQHLYAGRYNCSQCHAPQATNDLVDDNHFKPVYTAPDGAEKSSWNQSKWMKDIDTSK